MTNPLRAGLPAIPDRIKTLPVDHRGYPVPAFVKWIDGKPDFRVIDRERMAKCVQHDNCWICGQKLGRHKAFVVGPMCTINRISGEPPAHLECALFAARACPFMILPTAQRRETNLPEDGKFADGHCPANPGTMAIWVTSKYRPLRHGDSLLFHFDSPTSIFWFRKGRNATRQEVLDALKNGCATLLEQAEKDGEGAVAQLRNLYQVALGYLPPAALGEQA